MPFSLLFLIISLITSLSSSSSSSLPLFSTAEQHHLQLPCSSTRSIPQHQQHCLPFNSTPPFPFSTSFGCGHPSFLLNCSSSSSFSLLHINNLSFSLLNYDPSSSSLTLSPLSSNSQSCPSSFSHIPSHPINLSNSPFKLSQSSCSRLSLLKPCLPLPNCTLCPWLCSLTKNPLHLVHHSCGPISRPISEQGCQRDVLGYLDHMLTTIGIQVEFQQDTDQFFTKCKDCQSSSKNGVCGFNSSDPKYPFLCFREAVFPPSILVHHKNKIALFSSVFILLCLLCFLVISLITFKNWRFSNNNNANPEDPMAIFLNTHRSNSLLPPVFTYEELESSTNRFDPRRKIGDGGFGSVFLGMLFDGRTVAVKYLHRNGGKAVSTKSFCNEILILSSIDHPNLVKLHGYCSDPRGLLLVYDYIPNGTLADHLHGPSRKISGPLSWQIRVDIALQIAIAVEYLHFTVQPPVVHRDITTSNIFVDQYLRVRVGDFGLSRLLICQENLSGELSGSSSGCVWTGPQGTPGYLDPDYHKSFRLTEKSDVYSFGVVLLELITGLKAVDQRREKREVGLVDMVVARIQLGLLEQVVDPALAAEGPIVAESVAAVAELAFRCVAADKDDRPDAQEVVAELRRIWSRTRGIRGSNANVVVVPAVDEG